MKDTLSENPYIGFRRNYFSDCIVYSAKRTSEGLYEMFQATGLLTLNLLQYDVMVSGGLTAGGTHHSRDFIYGTAMNRAVIIEHDIANDPMTMVSNEVVEDAISYGPQHQQWIAQDPSGKNFVHFLISYVLYRHEPIWEGK